MSPIITTVLKETAKIAIPVIINELFKDDNKKTSHRPPKHKNRRPNYKNKTGR